MTTFKVGDKVICVDNTLYENYVKKDKVYTIKSIRTSLHCQDILLDLEEIQTGGMYVRRFKLAEDSMVNQDKYFRFEFDCIKCVVKNPVFDGDLIHSKWYYDLKTMNMIKTSFGGLGSISDLKFCKEITKEEYESLISTPHILINGKKIEARNGVLIIYIGTGETVSIPKTMIAKIYPELLNMKIYQEELGNYTFNITPVVQFGCQTISLEDCQKLCKFIEDNKLV